MPKFFNECIKIVDKEILSKVDHLSVLMSLSLYPLSTARPALRIALEILLRGVQFNLRSKGDPQ